MIYHRLTYVALHDLHSVKEVLVCFLDVVTALAKLRAVLVLCHLAFCMFISWLYVTGQRLF